MNPWFLRYVLRAIAVLSIISAVNAADLGTGFTYQGLLKNGGRPVEGTADFQFTLWDTEGTGNPPTGGTQVGGMQAINALPVSAGLFTVLLNAGGEFGSDAFDGSARWLQIAVRYPTMASNSFITLAPRQPITATPYALRAVHGLGPPGFSELTPNGQLILTNHLLFDPDNWTIAALTDEGTAPLTLESRRSNGDKTQLRVDDANSSVTIQGQLGPTNTAGITPPPKLRIALETADANTAGTPGDGVSFTAIAADGETFVPLRLRGNVGIGTDFPSEQLDVNGNIHATGTITGGGLEVVKSADPVAVFDRTTDDGTIISLRRDGIEQGTISVSATTVSYNAFTGSHYGWTDRTIERGTLVVMTGENRRRYDDPGAEPIYGIGPSVAANDSKCLGTYLGLLEPAKAASMENPHQVMAVGNGDMWIVDTGKSIAPGDYLISSDAPGHAMLDDETRFPVGYVVARAGEGVDWAKVSESVEGRKHKRISVFFENFERGSAVGLGKIVEQQQSRIEELSKRISELEAAKGGAQ